MGKFFQERICSVIRVFPLYLCFFAPFFAEKGVCVWGSLCIITYECGTLEKAYRNLFPPFNVLSSINI